MGLEGRELRDWKSGFVFIRVGAIFCRVSYIPSISLHYMTLHYIT